MVGKGGETKSSRIFQQCYVKCCKLQNLTPLNNLIPSDNGKVLDFCVDRIRYVDWPPILNALSCDLSLHSVTIKCRQPVKTVLEHIDCERLAKTVNKRPVMLTNFMLTNLVEAFSMLLTNTTLLATLHVDGLPIRIPYLNPLCEALLWNNSLQHVSFPRCQLGDAGCLALCKAVRCLPNILTLDLSGCDLTPLGAQYIADLIKYQKIHRYSENWVHTLRYRLPELDAMAGLRRITLCNNPELGDAGVGTLLEVLSDDLWIKALDVQNCGLTEVTADKVQGILQFNTTLVVLDVRHNCEISSESLSKLRAALRQNERGVVCQYSWLSLGSSSEGRTVKSSVKNGVAKDRLVSNTRSAAVKHVTKPTVKKEKEYTEALEEQLQEEISHRQQLEELNVQLIDQMKELKKQQLRIWTDGPGSSGSERSLMQTSRSFDMSCSSGSSSSVPIDQNTLSYIQQAFKDIYNFIKNNQCNGECRNTPRRPSQPDNPTIEEEVQEIEEVIESTELRASIVAKKAQSTHLNMVDHAKVNKTRSAHHVDISHKNRDSIELNPDMFERQIGDTQNSHMENHNHNLFDEMIAAKNKSRRSSHQDASSACSSTSIVSDSSGTLVYASERSQGSQSRGINPRDALCSSSSEEDSS